MAEKKTQQIGVITKNKDEEGNVTRTIKLGNPTNQKVEHRYTVKIQVLNADGEVILTKTNPTVNMYKPTDKAPEWIEKNLAVYLVDSVPRN